MATSSRQIDPRRYEAALAAAQAKKTSDDAQLANAQRGEARYTGLARSNFASRQQLDTEDRHSGTIWAMIQGVDAAIASAHLNLDFTMITSPIDGRTGLRLVDAGNLVHATDATGLITLTRLGKNLLRRARGAAWRRPAWVFEHRSGAAIWAVSTGAQKTRVGWPAQ